MDRRNGGAAVFGGRRERERIDNVGPLSQSVSLSLCLLLHYDALFFISPNALGSLPFLYLPRHPWASRAFIYFLECMWASGLSSVPKMPYEAFVYVSDAPCLSASTISAEYLVSQKKTTSRRNSSKGRVKESSRND